MKKRFIRGIGLTLLVIVAGCSGLISDSGPTTTFNLVVQNDGSEPITYQVTVSDETGAVVNDETDQLGARIGMGYDFSIDGSGRHEVVVTSDDWAHTVSLTPAACEAYEVTLRVIDDATQIGGGCVTFRE